MHPSCCMGGKDSFGDETEFSGDNVQMRKEEGEARAGGTSMAALPAPCTLWACDVPATVTVSSRQQEARRPWSLFLEMSRCSSWARGLNHLAGVSAAWLPSCIDSGGSQEAEKTIPEMEVSPDWADVRPGWSLDSRPHEPVKSHCA